MTETRLLILNGAELNNSSEQREAMIELQAIEAQCAQACAENELQMDFRQTDDSNQLLVWISDLADEADALIINPGAGFQGSDSLATAVNEFARLGKPVAEVHLHNIFNQLPQQAEPLNVTDGKTGFISGLGISGYTLAISSMATKLEST